MAARSGSDDQLSFDIEGMIHAAQVDAAPPWTGAPLHFTADYYPPDELDAAFAHWQFLHGLSGSHAVSHMWHRAIAMPAGFQLGSHDLNLYTVDLRCEPWKHEAAHRDCECVGDLTYQAICEPCGWREIGASENAAVEAWHDHALPGWRDLPIVPGKFTDQDRTGLSNAARRWITDHYPREMQVPGAPIITERGAGTRHVPGRSPWGGYDLSHTAVDSERRIAGRSPSARRAASLETPPRATMPAAIGLGD